MKPFFIFRFFPFFRQIAKRKVLVFCSQCFAYYTTTRENRELRQCDYIEEINFHHIVILAAAGSCAREGRIEHKKENTGTVLNMEENLSTGYTQSTTAR